MRLKFPKDTYNIEKEYTLYFEYSWNREIIRKDSGYRVRVRDWNETANNGRGELRASFGPEAARDNKILLQMLQRYDSRFKEYNIKHPGQISTEIVRSILNDKPLTRDDEGQDFVEFVKDNLLARYNANKIKKSRYENGLSGMKVFQEFLKSTGRGTYKADSIYLGEISGEIIDAYIDYRKNIKNNVEATINHSLTPIIIACESAKLRGYIPERVYAEIKYKRLVEDASPVDSESFDGRYLTKSDLQRLVDFYNADTEQRRKEYIEMFLFAFHTGGLRLVDIMTLQWKHIDFEKREMKKVLIKTARTQHQRHTVPLTPPAIAILNKWRERKRREVFVFDLLSSDDFDVTSQESVYQARNSVDKKVNQALSVVGERLGLPFNLTFHTARHSFAVNALNDPDNPLDMYEVSRLLGHSSTDVTERVYAEYITETLADRMASLNFGFLPDIK